MLLILDISTVFYPSCICSKKPSKILLLKNVPRIHKAWILCKKQYYIFICDNGFISLTLKRLGGQLDSPCGFSKTVSSRERVKNWSFETFNIITTFLKTSFKFLKSWFYVHQFFGFFWHFLVTKKLMTPVYIRRCHHVFTFNLL